MARTTPTIDPGHKTRDGHFRRRLRTGHAAARRKSPPPPARLHWANREATRLARHETPSCRWTYWRIADGAERRCPCPVAGRICHQAGSDRGLQDRRIAPVQIAERGFIGIVETGHYRKAERQEDQGGADQQSRAAATWFAAQGPTAPPLGCRHRAAAVSLKGDCFRVRNQLLAFSFLYWYTTMGVTANHASATLGVMRSR
jgi:hypothetical protein